MLRLARPNVTPPGGFRYYDADLKLHYVGRNVDHLVVQVNRARLINHLSDIPGLAAVIEDVICQGIPSCLTVNVPAERAVKDAISPLLPRSASNVPESVALQHTMSILRRAPSLISWNMAVPRASLCRSCEFNTAEPGCYGCKIAGVFATHVGTVKYRSGSDMSYAGVCSLDKTYTKATLRVNDPKVFGANGYPAHCWKLRKEVLHERE